MFITNILALLLYATWTVAHSIVPLDLVVSCMLIHDGFIFVSLQRYVDIAELNLMGLILLGFLFGPKLFIILFLYDARAAGRTGDSALKMPPSQLPPDSFFVRGLGVTVAIVCLITFNCRCEF